MTERIDHNNYEAWLLDRLEGNLTAARERMLDAFLAANPGLDPGMDELPTLNDLEATLSPADKQALKRTLPPTGLPGETLDDHLIARLEGDLSPVQLEALRSYLAAHPEHLHAERLYALTKLVPQAIAFAEKEQLLRELPPIGLPARHSLDDFLVARLEGALTPEQEHALTSYLATDPGAQRSWALMQHTRIPVEAVRYPAKQGLKKGGRVIAIGAARASWAVHLRVAATIAVLLSVGIWALLREPERAQQVAEQEQAPKGDVGSDDRILTDADTSSSRQQPAPVSEQPAPQLAQKEGSRLAKEEDQLGGDQGAHTTTEHEGRGVKQYGVPKLRTRMVELAVEPSRHQPVWSEVNPVAPGSLVELPEEDLAVAEREGIRLGDLLAGKLRKQVLDAPSDDPRPLDREDAVAALDKGLRSVVGDRSGLAVERKADGRVRSFDLRLGRNLAISASR